MKTIFSLGIILFFIFSSAVSRAEEAKVSITFDQMNASHFIGIYQNMSNAKTLTISSNVLVNLKKRVSLTFGDLPKAEALKLMQEALANQTGIILTPFGDKLSVTFNDQFSKESFLPFSPAPVSTGPRVKKQATDLR